MKNKKTNPPCDPWKEPVSPPSDPIAPDAAQCGESESDMSEYDDGPDFEDLERMFAEVDRRIDEVLRKHPVQFVMPPPPPPPLPPQRPSVRWRPVGFGWCSVRHCCRGRAVRLSVAACLFVAIVVVTDVAYARLPRYAGIETSKSVENEHVIHSISVILKQV